MSNRARLIVVLAILLVVAAALALKQGGQDSAAEARQAAAAPRLVDLGADKCIPCKMMAPILEELKTKYAGQFAVEFIDVWKDPAAGQKYGISSIPTQIFYDEHGKEMARHIGFISKEDILAKWSELGYKF